MLGSVLDRVDWRKLGLAAAVLLPVVVVSLATGDARWASAALVTVSCFIVAVRTDLAPLGVLMHGAAIIACFVVLLFAQLVPVIFVLCCVVLAAAVIWVKGRAGRLQSLGVWTFIPALYLACETAEGRPRNDLVTTGLAMIPYLTVAMVPVVVLAAVLRYGDGPRSGGGYLRSLRRVRADTPLGERTPRVQAMITVGLAVAVAAAIVEWRHLDHGQWVIWSVVSVALAGDLTRVRRKLRDRALGALAGVPVGIGLGAILPHTQTSYGLLVSVALVTVVAFRAYIIGFVFRCIFAAAAILVATDDAVAADARLINVVLGGALGVAFVIAGDLLAQRRANSRCGP